MFRTLRAIGSLVGHRLQGHEQYASSTTRKAGAESGVESKIRPTIEVRSVADSERKSPDALSSASGRLEGQGEFLASVVLAIRCRRALDASQTGSMVSFHGSWSSVNVLPPSAPSALLEEYSELRVLPPASLSVTLHFYRASSKYTSIYVVEQ